MSDAWDAVPSAAKTDDWDALPSPEPVAISAAAMPAIKSAVEPVLNAFGQGFREGWGPDRLGLPDRDVKWLSDVGLFAPEGAKGYDNPFHAFNEILAQTIWTAPEIAFRGVNALFRAGQALVAETGAQLGQPQLGREIAALPEAFFGSPHPLGMPKTLPKGVPRRVARDMSAVSDEVVMDHLTRWTQGARGEADTSLLPEAVRRFGEPLKEEATFYRGDSEHRPALGNEQGATSVSDLAGGFSFSMAKNEGLLENMSMGDAPGAKLPVNEIIVPAGTKVLDVGPHAGPNAGELERMLPPGQFVKVGERTEQFEFGADKRKLDRQITTYRFEPNEQAQGIDLEHARELGVIGPEIKPITEGTPVEAAQRAVSRAAEQTPDEAIRGPSPAADKAGNIRLDLITTHDDAKNVIRSAAEENGEFMPARRGEIPLAQVDALSQVTGIAPEDMNLRGMGRMMRNDNEVRVAIQSMIQSAEDTAAAMKKAALTDTPEDLIEFQRLRMRHSVLQEQVAGLTAEWGRTGNVFQEFAERAKDAKGLGEFLKDKKGESIDDLRNMVRAGSELDPRTQLPRFLNDARTPGFWDKAIFYWVNALISGPITHLKYVGANAAFAGYEAAIVTPLAATLGTVRKVAGSATAADRVLHGEAVARMWGLIAGTPDALVAAYKAGKTGLQTPLPGEIAQDIIPKQNKNIFFQQKPIDGAVGTLIAAPSRGASAIHSFFNFLGYRASIEQQAYRAAIKEGHSPVDDAFWQRRGDLADKPTVEMMDKSIEEGYRLTFIKELGPAGKKFAAAVNSFPPARLIMPFMHIPFNILREATNNTALAVFGKEMREDIGGKNGVAAQDTAIARVVTGSALGAWMVNLAVNDRATGFGPTDPKERALWQLTHQPYSLRIGGYWVSYNRFGPIGTLMGLHANLADALPHMKWDGEEATKAAALLVHSTGRLMMDEVGMQGLAGIIEAINEPERKGARFVSNFAGSWLPYSSMQRQVGSFMDPEMREVKTFIDGLRSYIPIAREGLYPKRDWTGTPVPNPGYHSVLRTTAVSEDFLAKEMQALDIKPSPPQDRIGGVKLTPKLYDQYQSTAGPFTRQALESMVSNPGWHDLPPYIRETTIKATIKSTREAAAAAMQAAHPEIIRQGMQDRIDHLSGKKPTKKLAAD